MYLETLFLRTFVESVKYQYRLNFIESSGEPRVGISTFYTNKGHWNPGKNNFFMAIEEWMCFMEAVAQFAEDGKRGASLTGSSQISISYIIFSIYSFDIIYNFLLILF